MYADKKYKSELVKHGEGARYDSATVDDLLRAVCLARPAPARIGLPDQAGLAGAINEPSIPGS